MFNYLCKLCKTVVMLDRNFTYPDRMDSYSDVGQKLYIPR